MHKRLSRERLISFTIAVLILSVTIYIFSFRERGVTAVYLLTSHT